eukprot:6478862-Amphidinium_carterae.1
MIPEPCGGLCSSMDFNSSDAFAWRVRPCNCAAVLAESQSTALQKCYMSHQAILAQATRALALGGGLRALQWARQSPHVMSSSSSARALVVDGVSFITHPQLTQLNAVIKAVDAGDRIVKGRLELFSFSRKKPTRRQLEELERVEPTSFTDSPLGPLSSDLGQALLSNLTSLMTL